MNTQYSFGTKVILNFEDAIEKVTQALSEEGFGILTEIDVKATFKKKLDKDFLPYKILGACNPNLAFEAISSEPSIGTLLPCNVLVRQDEEGQVYVEFMDPNAVLTLVDNPQVPELAKEVRARLTRVMNSL